MPGIIIPISSKQNNYSTLVSWAPLGLLTLAYLHCLSFSWLKWGDVVIDLGRDLDVARQIADGRTLYTEVRYPYGPLTPCLNGLLFRCFGTHLDVIIAMGLLAAAMMCLLVYRLTRCFAGPWGATTAAAGFLYICAFAHLTGNGIFNFVLPYTPAATYGILLVTASLFFLIRHVQERKKADFFISCVFLALAALTKLELFFAIAFTHGLFIAACMLSGFKNWRMYLCGYGAAVMITFGGYAFALWRMTWSQGNDNATFVAALSQRYLLLHMGLTDVRASLLKMAYSFFAAASVFGFAFLTGRWTPQGRVWQAAACAAAGAGGFLVYLLLSLELPFRFLPILAIAILLWLGREFIRHPAKRDTILAEILLWGCGTACMARMGLSVVSYHYGFFMLPIALLSFALLWFHYLPDWLSEKMHSKLVFSSAGTGIFLGLIAAHLNLSLNLYQRHTVEMNAPRGRLYLYNPPEIPCGQYYAAAIDLLSRMPPATRGIAVPQGVGLTFFSGLGNPFGLFGYVETEFRVFLNDDSFLRMLKANPPDLVIQASSDTADHGDGVFGKTYAIKSWAWISSNYKPCVSIGKGFIIIWSRSDVDPSPMLERLRAGTKP